MINSCCNSAVDNDAEYFQACNSLNASHGGGICAVRPRFPLDVKSISFVFEQFNSKLFQSLICASSALLDPMFTAGTMKW